MTIKNKFDLAQVVTLLTDKEKKERMVVGIKVCCSKSLLYELAFGDSSSWHYEAEISEPNEKKIGFK